MKRCVHLVLAVLLLVLCCGCKKQTNDIQLPTNFYYRSNPVNYNHSNGVIAAETREGSGYDQNLEGLIELYLQGPLDVAYLSPFPANVHVEELVSNDSVLQITLSSNFSNLSGHSLTIACACLSKTVIDLTQCDTVQISAFESDLAGNKFIEMKSDSFLFLDEYTNN